MDDETNLNATDPSVSELNPEGGAGDVTTSANPPKEEALTLKELNAIAGREFPTKAEAIKHIENLKGLVGDQAIAEARRKAAEFDKLNPKYNAMLKAYAEENSLSLDEAQAEIEAFLGAKAPTEKPTDAAASEALKRVTSLERDLAREKFIAKHPEAANVLEAVEALADKKGVSLESAYMDSPLAKLVSKSSTGEATTEPNKVIGAPMKVAKELEEKILSGKGNFEDKQALVKALGIAK